MKPRSLAEMMSVTFTRWNTQNAPRLGAALAYYALLSIAPLALLSVTICGIVFSQGDAQQRVLQESAAMIGPKAATVIQTFLQNAHSRSSGTVATVVAFVTLFFGASGVFLELQNALNLIWEAPPLTTAGWRALVRQRILSFGMILTLGFVLIGSLLLSASLAILERFATYAVPHAAAITGEAANLLVSGITVAFLFAAIYRFVPNVPISWHCVSVGAIVTAVLFLIGKELLSIYLTKAAVGSAYGAAGSLVALVVWVYYSAQIFFFGAVFTRVYAEHRSRLKSNLP